MKCYNWNDDGMVTADGPYERPPTGSSGEYVLHEDVEPIIADRDIKAANLKTLVDMVLAYAALDRGAPGEIDAAYNTLIALARGLKQ